MEIETDKRTDYERGYRDGYRDGLTDMTKAAQKSFNSCSRCGINLEGFLGYVCSQSHCPMVLKCY